MVMSFGDSMDSLANNRILNFDGEAFVKGTPARYYGAPEPKVQMPMDIPLPASPCGMYPGYGMYSQFGGARLNSQPCNDAFISRNEHISENFKIAGGIAAGVLGTFGLSKLLSKKKAADATATATTAAATTAPTATAATATATKEGKTTLIEKAKNLAKSALEKFKGAPKALRIGGGIVAAGALLYGIKRALTPSAGFPQNRLPEYPPM